MFCALRRLNSASRPKGSRIRRDRIHTVTMIRHGESTWNLESRFSGWCDVPLTEQGEKDAKEAGKLMKQRGMKFDVAYTSGLERAWRTLAIVLHHCDQTTIEVTRSWKLNERHYGALQGHLKNCKHLTETIGADQLLEYRRSWDLTPPLYDDPEYAFTGKLDLESRIKSDAFMNPGYKENPHQIFPTGESLEECQKRAYGYWKNVIAPRVKDGENVLIVAHANTIRALVQAIDNIDNNMMKHLKIPNGIPLVYTLDSNLTPILTTGPDDFMGFQAKYLLSANNHERILRYETCTIKKLTSLFNFLDKEGTGLINSKSIQEGLTLLQNSQDDSTGTFDEDELICEFEIEELLRMVPKDGTCGGIRLNTFLQSYENLMPTLSKVRFLQ